MITAFHPDADRLAVLAECMANHDVGDPDAEWPNNIISRSAVVYGSGVIVRKGTVPKHAVDADELARCQRLSAESAALMSGVEVGMGSAASTPFRDFFIAASVDERVPTSITEPLIRAKFGGTIFPPLTITVEPLTEAGVWWTEVQTDGADSGPDYFAPWHTMMRWFHAQPDFVTSAFVRIGNNRELWNLPQEKWPPGTALTGCVFPRLALGLTPLGSLIGLFGYSVKT